MNKKVALVTLIRHSLILPDATKLELINSVPSLNDRQIDALGKFLATERDMALKNEQEIYAHVDTFLHELEAQAQINQHGSLPISQPNDLEQVYVGSGRP